MKYKRELKEITEKVKEDPDSINYPIYLSCGYTLNYIKIEDGELIFETVREEEIHTRISLRGIRTKVKKNFSFKKHELAWDWNKIIHNKVFPKPKVINDTDAKKKLDEIFKKYSNTGFGDSDDEAIFEDSLDLICKILKIKYPKTVERFSEIDRSTF